MIQDRNIRRSLVSLLGIVIGLAAPGKFARAEGGNVMPPEAKPYGYSLGDVAKAIAYFTASGNNEALKPNTPFQILYLNGTNAFTVKTGTKFFVPLFGFDDSPPVLGQFPTTQEEAEFYFFDQSEVGVEFAEIVVDGQVTEIGPEYASAPATTPNLPDGGGSHFAQVGAFLTPLSKGTHSVTIRFLADGDALAPIGGIFAFEATYTVTVRCHATKGTKPWFTRF